MSTRIIPVTPVDETAHVYRTDSGEIIARVFDQGDIGLVPVDFRAHDDGLGFTLFNAPAGQVWVELKTIVINLSLLSSLDLSAVKAAKYGGMQPAKLAQGVRYSPPFGETEAVPISSDPMQTLIAEVRDLRAEITKMMASQFSAATSAVTAYK